MKLDWSEKCPEAKISRRNSIVIDDCSEDLRLSFHTSKSIISRIYKMKCPIYELEHPVIKLISIILNIHEYSTKFGRRKRMFFVRD